MPNYLERYQNGQYQQVWAELVALGSAVRQEPVYSDAREIAHAMMMRARHNIGLLVERLHTLRYRFSNSKQAWEQPITPLAVPLDQIEARHGPLPIVLRTWFEVVGQVSFTGTHPTLSYYSNLSNWFSNKTPGPISDPLVLEYIGIEGEDEEEAEFGSFIQVAPDAAMKANQSGGGPTSIALPAPGFDAPLISWDACDGMYVIEYLRNCFEWGGFPGFADDSDAAEAAKAELAFLKKDLLLI